MLSDLVCYQNFRLLQTVDRMFRWVGLWNYVVYFAKGIKSQMQRDYVLRIYKLMSMTDKLEFWDSKSQIQWLAGT